MKILFIKEVPALADRWNLFISIFSEILGFFLVLHCDVIIVILTKQQGV